MSSQEIYCKRWFKFSWEDIAIVYKHGGEFIVEPRELFSRSPDVKNLIEEAKVGLENYVNAEGVEQLEGSTSAGLALELMLKRDGTAMGVQLEE